jgi:hypothetical protein
MSRKVVVCLIALAFVATGCYPTPEEQFTRDLRTLDTAWQQGGEARKSLLSKGLTADTKSCAEIYSATGASDHPQDSKQFAAKRQAYFINGCLGLPKPGSATSTSLPTTTAPHSVTSTTAG